MSLHLFEQCETLLERADKVRAALDLSVADGELHYISTRIRKVVRMSEGTSRERMACATASALLSNKGTVVTLPEVLSEERVRTMMVTPDHFDEYHDLDTVFGRDNRMDYATLEKYRKKAQEMQILVHVVNGTTVVTMLPREEDEKVRDMVRTRLVSHFDHGPSSTVHGIYDWIMRSLAAEMSFEWKRDTRDRYNAMYKVWRDVVPDGAITFSVPHKVVSTVSLSRDTLLKEQPDTVQYRHLRPREGVDEHRYLLLPAETAADLVPLMDALFEGRPVRVPGALCETPLLVATSVCVHVYENGDKVFVQK